MLLTCLFFVAGTTSASTFTVTNTTDCATPGCGSLRQAIVDANNNAGVDTINFASGLTGTITLANGELIIDDLSGGALTINGPGADQLTINGNQGSRIVQITSTSTATISGLTIANGRVSGGFGGGILNLGTLTLIDSAVSGNSTDSDAGGIYNQGTLRVVSSTVSGNTGGPAGLGGGILNQTSLTVINSTISGNSANEGLGGGIVSLGTLDISSSTIVNNSASIASGGGGLAVLQANVKNSIIANNTSGGDCFFVLGLITASGANYATDNTCPGFTEVTSAQLNLGALTLNAPGTAQTHALGTGSVAIDAATDCTDLSTPTPVAVNADQRGVARPQGTACDAGSFEVEVEVGEATPEEMIEELRKMVQAFGLHHGIEKALLSKLNAALAAFADADAQEARERLSAFICQVNSQRGKHINAQQADELAAAAQKILDAFE